jgi:long-chain fatty acid transport protein
MVNIQQRCVSSRLIARASRSNREKTPMPRRHWSLMVMCWLLLAAAERAEAQGYGVYEQGACAMARGGAAVARPCEDGSAIFFNPAAIAVERGGSRLSVGGTLIGPRGEFTSFDGRSSTPMAENWVPVPAAYYTRPTGDRLALGLGLFVPYGLTTEWPIDFEGRYVSYKTSLQTTYVQPTIAFKINDHLAIGGGPDLVFSRLELNQRADLSVQSLAPGITFAQIGVPPGTDFADVRISGTDFTLAAHVGVLVRATDTVSFGARYLSRHTISRDDLTLESHQIATGLRTPVPLPGIPQGTPIDALVAPIFAPGGRLANQQAATELTAPDQFVAGVAIQPTTRLTLLADYQFTAWSVFENLAFTTTNGLSEIVVKNYRDTSGVRIGADYRATDRVTIRGGIVAHQAAAPDGSVTPDLPEGARMEYTAGLGARMNDRFSVDVAYQYIDQETRDGRTLVSGPDTGTYAFHANLFGVSLLMRF